MLYKTVNNAIITLGDTDVSGKGKRFKSRFIQPGIAGYPGQFGNVLIKKETFDKFINTMVGVPVIINHKAINSDNANDERVGVVSNVWFDEKDGWYWCDGVIWDETAQNLITEQGWSVSCSYDVLKADDEGGSENNIPYDIEFLDGVFTHLALVNNPRYERANIVFNSKTSIVNYREDQKRDEKGRWTKDDAIIQQKKDNLTPIEINTDDIPEFETKEQLGEWFKGIFEDLGNVTIEDTGIKIDLYGGNAEREAFKRRLQQLPNKAVAKAFDEVVSKSIKVNERAKDERHKHNQEQYYNKIKLGKNDYYDVDVFVDYLEKNDEYRYAGHKTTKIDNKISTRDTQVINHIMLTKVDTSIITDTQEHFNPTRENMLNNVENENWKTLYDKNGEPYHVDLEEKNEPEAEDVHSYAKRMLEEAQKLKEKEAAEKQEYRDLKGFEKTLSPLERGKAEKFLNSDTYIRSEDGEVRALTQKQFIIESLKDGYNPIERMNKGKKEYVLQKPMKDYRSTYKINKISFNFAEYLKKNNIIPSVYGKDAYLKYIQNAYLNNEIVYQNKNLKISDSQVQFPRCNQKVSNSIINGIKNFFNPNGKQHEVNNEKEQEMALIEELKKLINKAENSKGEEMDLNEINNEKSEEEKKDKEVENEKVDKRKLIDEVGGILKGKVDEEIWRTVIGKIEKIGYNKSEAGTADNSIANNESEQEKEKVKELKEDIKKDVNNSKTDYFAKMNEVYNASQATKEETLYVSRADRLKAGEEMFRV